MFQKFAKSARIVVGAAEGEARALGAPHIEAEHVLLALTDCELVRPALAEAGLDRDRLVEALELEFATALETVGVSAATFGPPPAVPVAGSLRFGTSAKVAMEQALRIAAGRGDKRLEPAHLALAVLRPGHGTVPRALAVAGLDRTALQDRIAATL